MGKINYVLIFMLLFISFSFKSIQINEKRNLKKNISLCDDQIIFENLLRLQKDSFITKNRELLNKHVLSYYDNYLSIKNGDTIFSLIYDCRTKNEKIIPFYFYVINQLSKISDGYLGEAISGYFSDLFFNHPRIIYSYLDKYKNDENGKYKALLFDIMFEVNGRELSNSTLDSIFNSHKKLYPGCEEIINKVHSFMLKNKSY